MTASAPFRTGEARIGAFDPAAWAGLVFCPGPGRGFGLRIAVEKDGERAEAEDLFWLVHEVGPHAPDLGYARVAFDLGLPFGRGAQTPVLPRAGLSGSLVLEWSRALGEDRVVGRVACGVHATVELQLYFPWDWRGSWRYARGLALSREAGGAFGLALAALLPGIEPEAREGEERLTLRFAVAPGSTILLSAALGTPPQHAEPLARRHADPTEIATHLAAAAARYASTRARVETPEGDAAAAVTNNLHWMVALQPESGRRYTPAGRRWIFPAPGGGRDDWTVFEWDAFFNALELAVESPELARETVGAVLGTQYPNGNIPNWRSRHGGTPDRSQPPVGSFAVLKLYERTGDLALLAEAFPVLERWSAWWRAPKGHGLRRDGNGNGLFEWGCDEEALASWTPPWEASATGHQRAAWESGQDDLPSWQEARFVPETGTYDLESVDLNALLALDDECLSRIAALLGEDGRSQLFAERAERQRRLVNERLWCEEQGLYLDRSWDGRFSPRVAAGNFFPLLAGVPSPERARRMLETLLDPERFWGELVLPSISRQDPLYAEQQYWRGTIWPPTNYLVGQGLRRCGFDAEAAELAARGARLFLRDFATHQVCRENFDSRSGAGGGQRHQSWGPLFALLAIEEVADATPFEGLRLGSLSAAEARARRLVIRGREWDVTVSPRGLSVRCDGWTALRSDAPVVLRHVALDTRRIAAEAHAPAPVRLRPGFAAARAVVEGRPAALASGALGLPAGRHRFELTAD